MDTQNTQETQGQNQQEQTFTQAELNKVVKERLAREKERYADYDELKASAQEADAAKKAAEAAAEREKALQAEIEAMKAAEEIRKIRADVSAETGVPVELLTMDTKETCKSQAEAILKFARPGYPKLWDGGEARNTTGKKSTREQFAAYATKALGG